MNEIFSVSKSFFWRRRHHDNNVASLLKLHSCFLQSSQISLFSLTALVSLKFNKSKNHKNISTFHLFTHVHAGANCVNQNSHLFFSILSFFYIKEWSLTHDILEGQKNCTMSEIFKITEKMNQEKNYLCRNIVIAPKFVITFQTWELFYALSQKRTAKNTPCWKAKQTTSSIVRWRLLFAIFDFGRLDFNRDPLVILLINIQFLSAQHVHKTWLHTKQDECK